MPEGAVPQLREPMNGEQNLNEEWLFIRDNNTKKKPQKKYQAKGSAGTKTSIFSYAPN